MSTALLNSNNMEIEKALMEGDLSGLTTDQCLNYYKNVCDSVGLNPLTKPFEYMKLNGKKVLYATKAAGEQLRKIHTVSVKVVSRENIGGVYVVTAEAKLPDGREDSSTGAIAIEGLKGDALANCYMKAETKAKRRVTLSICGLGMLDESELDTIHGVKPFAESQDPTNQPPQLEVTKAIPGHQPVPGDYIVPFGKKYKGFALKNIHPEEIEGYCQWLEKDSKEKGKPITGPAAEFMDMAVKYLQSIKWIAPKSDANEDDIPF